MKQTIEEQFLQATKAWYAYVNEDHHKDHDCHFYVSYRSVYSYGQEPSKYRWKIEQIGYITMFVCEGDTKEEVMKKCIKQIYSFIENNPLNPVYQKRKRKVIHK